MNKEREIVLVGCGFVSMSMAYNFLSTGEVDRLVLIDVNREKTIGEAMGLQHGLPYTRGRVSVKAGGYEECRGTAVVVMTAGVAQRPTETRLDLTARGTVIMKSVTKQIIASSFGDILVITSSPTSVTTYVTQKASGLPTERVVDPRTILDTARLRCMTSEYLDVSTSNIHAYIMGEHGDSSFVPWTDAYVGCKDLLGLLDEKGRDLSDLHDIYTNVQQARYEVMKHKRSAYYRIGLSLNWLVHAILDDENVILTVSAYQNSEYGREGLHTNVPVVVNRQGIRETIELGLNGVDQAKFNQSCETVRDIDADAIDPLLQKTNSALPIQCTENGKSGVPAYKDWFFLDCG